MDYLKPGKIFKWQASHAVIVTANGPITVPMEPITKPIPIITPTPEKDDPFNVPAPKINPTPKGLELVLVHF